MGTTFEVAALPQEGLGPLDTTPEEPTPEDGALHDGALHDGALHDTPFEVVAETRGPGDDEGFAEPNCGF
jgi:hypothetical protein